MMTMWKSSEDAVKDLALLDCFGGIREKDVKADLTKEASPSKEKTPNRFIDPKTGEEIEIQSECRIGCHGNSKTVTIGRGKLIEEFKRRNKLKRLQNQLRMNRPLGFGNTVIESYFRNCKETEEPPPPPLPTTMTATSSREGCTEKSATGQWRNVLKSSLREKIASDGGEASGGKDDMFS